MGTSSCQRLQKCTKLTYQAKEDDAFSRLPDEIIVTHILPRLTLQEAVQSSLLSRRWKNLWIHSIGPKLIFSNTFDKYYSSIRIGHLNHLRRMLASGFTHILERYPKPTLDEFKVRFDFDSSSSDAIDSWVDYALRKGVTRLELDLSTFTVFDKKRYAFPRIGIEKLSALHNLRDVCLKYVNVSSEVVELMLSSCCPSLERLCVWESTLRKKLKISGQSQKLKSLEFVRCLNTKVKLSSSNIVSLRYSGDAKALRINNVPLLSELSIGEGYCRSFLKTGSQNFECFAQLRRLTLDMSSEIVKRPLHYPLEFPQLIKLEQLDVRIEAYGDSCLLWPIILINAAPFLHKFSVQLCTLVDFVKAKIRPKQAHVRSLRSATKRVRHQSLKHIEMRGFIGCPSEMELGEHLVGISQSLEQVVVATYLPIPEGREKPHDLVNVEFYKKKYGEQAKQLTRWLPQGADLLVL